MDVSVIICTYSEERWNELVSAIESIQEQSLAPMETIVVVDHNLKLFRRVSFELKDKVIAIENSSIKGLSGAKNAGISIANGDQIAFLDDDAIAEPDWLGQLVKWMDEPNVLGVGGRVLPFWRGKPPRWLPEEFFWIVGCSYKGLPEKATPVRNTFGGCALFLRTAFDIVGDFRTDIGRKMGLPAGCEETEFCIRAGQHWPQGTFIYEPEAVIHHNVPESRATWSYFFSRCYHEGISKALVARHVGVRDALASERTYTLRVLPRGVARGVGEALFHGDLTGLARAAAILGGLAATTVGYLSGLARMTNHRKGKKGINGAIDPIGMGK